MAIDPVCKMEVEEESAPGHTEYDGLLESDLSTAPGFHLPGIPT